MSEDAFDLVGVAFGAILAGAATILVWWLNKRRDERGALGAIKADLAEAAEAVSDTLKGGKWPPGWNMAWSQSWITYRPVLSVSMKNDEAAFRALAKAYLYMGQLETSLEGGARPFVDDDPEFLDRVRTHLDLAERAVSD